MEINLGDLGISPAMLARIQAGGGIMGKPKPKGKKKAVAKKAKPGVKLRRGKPVASVNTPPLNANLVAGTEPTREEQRDIMNVFFGGNAIYPGDPGYEAALAEAGPSSGGLFSGGANLTPEQAERIKAAQAANPGGGFFGKGTNTPNGGSGANTSNSKFNEALLNGVGNIPSKPNTTKMTNNRTPKKLTTQDIQRAMSNMNLGGMF